MGFLLSVVKKILISLVATFQELHTLIYGVEEDEDMDILKTMFETPRNKRLELPATSKGKNPLAQVVIIIEWLARSAIYPEQERIDDILYGRIEFCCEKICEHIQRDLRSGDNEELFGVPYVKQTKQMQTFTNVFNLSHRHVCKDYSQKVPKGGRNLKEKYLDQEEFDEIKYGCIDWFSGDLDVDSQHQWWYSRYGLYLLNVSKGVAEVYDTKTRVREKRKRITGF